MRVTTEVRQNQIGVETALQVFESLLDGGTVIRKKAVAKGVDGDGFAVCRMQQGFSTCLRFVDAVVACAQDKPVDFEARVISQQAQYAAPTADLDIVRVCADREQPTQRSSRIESEHQTSSATLDTVAARGCFSQTAHGRAPLSKRAFRFWRSFIVSIGA